MNKQIEFSVLDVVHSGSVSSSDCLEQQALAQRTNGSSHVPRCLPDGKYAPVQCHGQSDYCWCVDELGKLIRGISYHKTRISCHQRRAAAAAAASRK